MEADSLAITMATEPLGLKMTMILIWMRAFAVAFAITCSLMVLHRGLTAPREFTLPTPDGRTYTGTVWTSGQSSALPVGPLLGAMASWAIWAWADGILRIYG